MLLFFFSSGRCSRKLTHLLIMIRKDLPVLDQLVPYSFHDQVVVPKKHGHGVVGVVEAVQQHLWHLSLLLLYQLSPPKDWIHQDSHICWERRPENTSKFLHADVIFPFLGHQFLGGWRLLVARHDTSPLWNRTARWIFGKVINHLYQDLDTGSFLRWLASAWRRTLFYRLSGAITNWPSYRPGVHCTRWFSSYKVADKNPDNFYTWFWNTETSYPGPQDFPRLRILQKVETAINTNCSERDNKLLYLLEILHF